MVQLRAISGLTYDELDRLEHYRRRGRQVTVTYLGIQQMVASQTLPERPESLHALLQEQQRPPAAM